MNARVAALTAVAVRALKPGDKRREVPDRGCPGLFLVVQPSGHKSWALRFRRPNGRPAKLTLGAYADHDVPGEPVLGGPLTLAAARQLATAAQRQRAHGLDPAAERQQAKQAAERGDDGTFTSVARRFLREHAMIENRQWPEQARRLGINPRSESLALLPKGIADRWRAKQVREVTASDIYDLIAEVHQQGIPGLEVRRKGRSDTRATSFHAALSSLFGWCVKHRVLDANPAASVWRPEARPARERTLTDAEIASLWRACEAIGPPFGQLYQLLLLTGQRRDEAAAMSRAEVQDGIWTIPAERTKNGREHTLPLPALALETLDRVPRIAPETFIFTTRGTRPISGFSKVKTRIDSLMKPEKPWRVHDLRRTAATGMARVGVHVIVIERVLNHVSGSFAGIVGTYQRHKYLAEMKDALEKWAKLIAEITDH